MGGDDAQRGRVGDLYPDGFSGAASFRYKANDFAGTKGANAPYVSLTVKAGYNVTSIGAATGVVTGSMDVIQPVTKPPIRWRHLSRRNSVSSLSTPPPADGRTR